MEEGCLSLPGMATKVSRSKTVRVRYWDENWEEHEEVVEGFAARIVQHECEQSGPGHVAIDNVSAVVNRLNKGKLNSIIKGTVHCSCLTGQKPLVNNKSINNQYGRFGKH